MLVEHAAVHPVRQSYGGIFEFHTHVNRCPFRDHAQSVSSICRSIAEKMNKGKKTNVKPFMVKNYLSVFINCMIENPAFDSQVGRPINTQTCAACAFTEDGALRACRSVIVASDVKLLQNGGRNLSRLRILNTYAKGGTLHVPFAAAPGQDSFWTPN